MYSEYCKVQTFLKKVNINREISALCPKTASSRHAATKPKTKHLQEIFARGLPGNANFCGVRAPENSPMKSYSLDEGGSLNLSSYKRDLAKQGCPNLYDSHQFQYEFLQYNDVCQKLAERYLSCSIGSLCFGVSGLTAYAAGFTAPNISSVSSVIIGSSHDLYFPMQSIC